MEFMYLVFACMPGERFTVGDSVSVVVSRP